MALDFPFLDELNDLLARIEEAGIATMWKINIQKLAQEYYIPLSSNTPRDLKAYSMNDLWFAFVLLFIGYATSTIVLMFELIFKKYKSRITIFFVFA